MSISCGCDFYDGIIAAGNARIVTCRTPRSCSDCGGQINKGDVMYVQSMFDYDDCTPSIPHYMCERCGDLAESLADAGYCFSFGGLVEQWAEYLLIMKEPDE